MVWLKSETKFLFFFFFFLENVAAGKDPEVQTSIVTHTFREDSCLSLAEGMSFFPFFPTLFLPFSSRSDHHKTFVLFLDIPVWGSFYGYFLNSTNCHFLKTTLIRASKPPLRSLLLSEKEFGILLGRVFPVYGAEFSNWLHGKSSNFLFLKCLTLICMGGRKA